MPNHELKSINLLISLDKKSDRVKGLSFHPTRSWLLVSLRSGEIQMWDYRMGVLIDTYNEHLGPVRSVTFHPNLPLFASGGDDFKVKIWNYKEKRCIFDFLEHEDYIRTVSFHHEYPWVLSASDDCTIRISNWQNRQMVTILVGHNHYVMCAQFHPTEDLVISSSLDGTIRLWDISAIRRKSVNPSMGVESSIVSFQNDILGNFDVFLKFVVENDTTAGINWVSFHPNSPMLVSGSDDRQVKLWRYTDSRMWESNSFYGHYNNVTCCIFHPHLDCVISCSEDKTIRFWDSNSCQCLYTYRCDDRLWILACHPEHDIFAAGHDSGFIVFKLRYERPAYATVYGANGYQSVLYINRDNCLCGYDFVSGKDAEVLSLRRGESLPRWVLVNSSANLVLVVYGNETYDLYNLEAPSQFKHRNGFQPTWVTYNLYATLDRKSNQIVLHNETTEVSRRYDSPVPGTMDAIYPAALGRLLVRAGVFLVLFDLQRGEVVASYDTTPTDLKFAYWSIGSANHLILMADRTLHLLDANFALTGVVSECMKIKCGLWTSDDVFLYTTMTHIKYLLPNGDSGIIRTLEQKIYITGFVGNKIFCLDRHTRNRVISVDMCEVELKNALYRGEHATVLRLIKGNAIVGQAIVNYLQAKGFPELAFHFVRDESMRFKLALECGNLDEALRSALNLDRIDVWNALASDAMRLGAPAIAEIAYQKSHNFEKLSFLYLITGQLDSLRKLGKMARNSNRIDCAFEISILLGDVPTRIELLEKTGQIPLAYITAELNGFQDEAQRLKAIYESKRRQLENIALEDASSPNDGAATDTAQRSELPQWMEGLKESSECLKVPNPLVVGSNFSWPLLSSEEDPFDALLKDSSRSLSLSIGANAEHEVDISELTWVNDQDSSVRAVDGDIVGNQWDFSANVGDEDADDVSQRSSNLADGRRTLEFCPLPERGHDPLRQRALESTIAGEHIAMGSFGSAMRLLQLQIGVIDFGPLKKPILEQAFNNRLRLNLWPGNSLELPLSDQKGGNPSNLSRLVKTLQVAYRTFTAGNFQESLEAFESILLSVPLLILSSNKEAKEAKELVAIAAEYILGLNLEIKRKSGLNNKELNPVQLLALATYFTHFHLQSFHTQLTLKSAMNFAKKLKCYGMAHKFGKRLLNLSTRPEVIANTKKLLEFCEGQGLTDELKIEYDEKNPFTICATDHVPIYKGSPSIICPYCHSHYSPKYESQLCKICKISKIGAKTTGLTLVRQPTKNTI